MTPIPSNWAVDKLFFSAKYSSCHRNTKQKCRNEQQNKEVYILARDPICFLRAYNN
uniref:Uncharacterized protein n=1 Tax=Rhizophora mucronata TaxID=61149 RepID=A0A2P2LMD6_RHIMU